MSLSTATGGQKDILLLINRLRDNNIDLALLDNDLEISYDGEQLPATVLSEIKHNKQGIVDFLKKVSYTRESHIPAAAPSPDYPVSSSQRRLYLGHKLGEGGNAYNLPGVYVFDGCLDMHVLTLAFDTLIQRHEILRTVFTENEEGDIRQVVQTPAQCGFVLEYRDLGKTANADAVVAEEIRRTIHRSFDLAEGPLLRAALYQMDSDRWIFVYVMHHIISDGWSMNILVSELLLLYNTFLKGEKDPLSPLRIQYKDYASWQQAQLNDTAFKEHRAYWLRQFEGELPVLDLPAGNPRPAIKTSRGGTVITRVPQPVADAFRTLVHANGCTFFMGALALVNTLFHRYTGQTDVVIGTPVAGRHHLDLEDQIGFYINTLALRTRFSETASFIDLLSTVRRVTLEAYEHQAYPFDELVSQLRLQRDPGRSLLFDVMIVQQNAMGVHDRSELNLTNVRTSVYQGTKNEVSKFDLTIDFIELPDAIQIEIEYNADIFTRDGIQTMAGHLAGLMQAAAASPDVPVRQLDYLSETEKKRLLDAYNDTKTGYANDDTLTDLFQQQVRLSPDRTAIISEGEIVSFRELNELANRIGNYLRSSFDIRPDDLVGVKLPRTKWLIASILGILKSGAAYIPIDPEYPADRIDYIVTDSNCRTLVDEDFLKAFVQEIEKYDRNDLPKITGPHHLAYAIYTSGSTGKPKGCLLEHTGVVNRIEWMWRHYHFETDDVILQKTNCTFDVSVWEIFMPLCFGAKMVICPKDDAASPERILSLIREHQVTCLHFVPGMLRTFIVTLFDDAGITGDLRSLRRVFASGEALAAGTVRRWYTRSAAALHNLYGPTEASVDVTYYATSPEDTRIPIGRPIWNTRIYVLDADDRLVPEGVTGQICLGGIGLARGYLNKPALTSEKFTPDPYRPDERIYRTGDLGRWLSDGNIEFLGRMDHQVKIRGYRIEPGEIESALQRYEGVTAAVVLARTGMTGDAGLVAYLVSKHPLDMAGIRSFLKSTLPAYMLPDHFVQLEKLPLNASGKLDRKQLPDPGQHSLASGTTYIAPRTKREKELAAIWEFLLERDHIGLEDNFFELGGHSLKANRLASHIHKTFQIRLSLRDLFDNPLLGQQARLIGQGQRMSFDVIPLAARMPDYPLSSPQRRLWILNELDGNSSAYNIPVVYLFEGQLDVAALNYSFGTLIRRHESLRTVFRKVEGEGARQIVLSAEDITAGIQYIDCRRKEDPRGAAGTWVQRENKRPFDLTNGPLMRVALLQLTDDTWVFNLVLHHIICDGWSMNVLMTELLHCYEAGSNGREAMLPPLRIQYKDYAVWQARQLAGSGYEEHKAYWLRQFEDGVSLLALPPDKVRPPMKTYNGRSVARKLDAATTRAFTMLVRSNDATLYMGLLAVLDTLLSRYTGQTDFVIGCPVAGRDHADLDDQIGFYLNTLALRTRFSPTCTFLELLQIAREVTLEGYEHQVYPFDTLLDELPFQWDASRSPLFDVMLALQNNATGYASETVRPEKVRISEYITGASEGSKFDLSFNFVERADEIDLQLVYNTDIYLPSTIGRLADHFLQLLSAILADPQTPIHQLKYLDPHERDQLLIAFNDTKCDYPRDHTVVDIFGQQALKTPDDLAMVFGDTGYTYRTLDQKSNQLANYLAGEHKAGPGHLVGVLLDRSAEMIIAIYSILKTGAAYVPIDPELPAARIAFILKDTGVTTLLTTTEHVPGKDDFRGSVFCMDQEMSLLTTSIHRPDIRPTPEDLAYVIFTSGSTGLPKGVMVSHASLIDYVHGILEKTNIRACRTFGLVSTIAADLGNTVIYTALLIGGTIHIFSREDLLDPDRIFGSDLDLLKIVPSHWKSLQRPGKVYIPNKCLILGGETLTPDIVRLIRNNHKQCELYNHYGPTEVTIAKVLNHVDLSTEGPVSLGKPFCDSSVYVLDNWEGLVPIGVVGEICISGVGLARGYIHRPELTAEKFVPNPFRPGERMYRTGDLGRWLPDGTLEFCGRKDDQVKVRGYRIELGEIEAVLRDHPDIAASFVTAKSYDGSEKKILAYIVCNTAVQVSDIRGRLIKILPAYMLPDHFIFLEELPLTPNGKVDRQRLPDPVGDGDNETEKYTPPRNDIEKKLVAIWEDLLGKAPIGIRDDYFQLGGNSLKVMAIIRRMTQATGVTVPLRTFFLERNIEAIAGYISGGTGLLTPVAEDGGPAEDATFYEASCNQMTFLSGWKKGNPLVITPYEFPGLDIGRFEQAVNGLIQRHETLRTNFVRTGDKVMQRVTPADKCYRKLPEIVRVADEAGLKELLERAHARVLDPFRDDLIIIELFSLWDGRCLVLLTMHHAITDGHSDGILRGELLHLYDAALRDVDAGLTPMRHQYRDYVKWQKDFLASSEGGRHRAYWLSRLNGFITDHTIGGASDGKDYRSANAGSISVSRVMEGPDLACLDDLARDKGLTRSACLMGMLMLLMRQSGCSGDPVVLTTVSGRNSRYFGSLDASGMIGYFANALVIRCRIDGKKPVLAFLQQVQETFLNDLDHEDYPLEKLIHELPGIEPAAFLDAQVFLNYHNYAHLNEHVYSIRDEDRKGVISYKEFLQMPMGLAVREFSNCLKLEMMFDHRRFTDGKAGEIAAMFFSLLQRMISSPHTPVEKLLTPD